MQTKFIDSDGYRWTYDSDKRLMKCDLDPSEDGGYQADTFLEAAQVLVAGYGMHKDFCTPKDKAIDRQQKPFFKGKWISKRRQERNESSVVARYIKHPNVEGLLVEMVMVEVVDGEKIESKHIVTTEEFNHKKNQILAYAQIGLIEMLRC